MLDKNKSQLIEELEIKLGPEAQTLPTPEKAPDKLNFNIDDLKTLINILQSDQRFATASPKFLTPCMRALKGKDHHIQGVIDEIEESEADASANGGKGSDAKEERMETDEPGVDANAGGVSDAGGEQIHKLAVMEANMKRKLEEMMQDVFNKRPCETAGFQNTMHNYNRAVREEEQRVKEAEKAAEEKKEKERDDKRKSLQAENESPEATPASNGGNAGQIGKVPAFAGDKWHADVKAQLTLLEKKGKLKEEELDKAALTALKALPY